MTRIMISDSLCSCGCDEVYFHTDNKLWQCVKCDLTVVYDDPYGATEYTLEPVESLEVVCSN